MTNEIKVAPMHKLIKRAGAARVSEESATALGRALEEIGIKVDNRRGEGYVVDSESLIQICERIFKIGG